MIGPEVDQGCETVRKVMTRRGGKLDNRVRCNLLCQILRGRDCRYLI